MIEKLAKAISALVPFLAGYPTWVKAVFSIWVMLSAVLLLVFLLAKPLSKKDNSQSGPFWLSLNGVDSFALAEGTLVKVFCEINGIGFKYPSKGNIEWMEIGPTMSPQHFKVPHSKNGYEMSFRIEAKKGDKYFDLENKETLHFNSVPFEGRYRLHFLRYQTKSASIAAEVKFSAKY